MSEREVVGYVIRRGHVHGEGMYMLLAGDFLFSTERRRAYRWAPSDEGIAAAESVAAGRIGCRIVRLVRKRKPQPTHAVSVACSCVDCCAAFLGTRPAVAPVDARIDELGRQLRSVSAEATRWRERCDERDVNVASLRQQLAAAQAKAVELAKAIDRIREAAEAAGRT